MKKILIFLIFINIFTLNSYSDELKDCSVYSKLNPKYLACKAATKISENMFKPNMFVGESWGIVYNKGKNTKRHSHWPYTYAFGYYLTDTKNSSPLIFPTANKIIHPKKGDLIVFPGHVQHEVPTLETDEERIMVAGNLYHSWTETKEKKVNDFFAKPHSR